MAMRFMDSVDHYDLAADITSKWSINPTISATITTAGRNGQGLVIGGSLGKTLDYQSGWVVGAAWRFTSPQGFSQSPIYQLMAANQSAGILVQMVMEADGSLSVWAGQRGAGTLIGNTANISPPLIIATNRWYYIEIKSSLSGSPTISASVTLRVNGVTILSGSASTNILVSSTLTNQAKGNFHAFAGDSANGQTIIDDIYIADMSGTGAINDFAGDLKISVLYPASDDTFTWTAVGGTTSSGFDHVNATFPETNDDTIYIKSTSTGAVADFFWQQLSTFTGTIVAVHYGIYARKDDEGSREFQPTIHGSATGSVVAPGDTYLYYFNAYDEDPATGVPWTLSGFNATDFGVKITT